MHAAPSAGHEVQEPAEKKSVVAVKISMPKTAEEMWSRLNEVADELGISRQAAMQQGHDAMASGQQLNWAEKQLRMIAGADSVEFGESVFCFEKGIASTEEGRPKRPTGPPK
eukprot:6080367-Prymnesium_polylepis.1